MELAPTPHPRARRPSPVVLVALTMFALAGLVLAPQALGLRHDVVRDGAMGPTWRGAVVVAADEPGRDLDVGDVITFDVPRRAEAASVASSQVTRRVTAVEDGVARTRADAAAGVDPWRLRLDASYPRVVGRAPYLGRVLEGGRATAGAAVAAGMVMGVLGLLLRPWARRRARHAPPPGVV